MMIKEISLKNAPDLIHYILTHHYLDEAELHDLAITDDLVRQHLLLKNEMRARSSRYDFNFLSLGENCLTISLPTRYGILPTNRQRPENNRGRLPFDLAFCPVSGIVSTILKCFVDFKSDAVVNVDKDYFFANLKYNFRFIHDAYNIQIGLIDNFVAFNKTLRKRADLFSSIVKQPNSLFVTHIFFKESVKDAIKALDTLKQKFNIPVLVITKYKEIQHDSIPIFHYTLPTSNYNWYHANNYLTNDAIAFERDIVDFILSAIESNFPKKQNYTIETEYSRENLYIRLANFYIDNNDRSRGKALLERALIETDGNLTPEWIKVVKRL